MLPALEITLASENKTTTSASIDILLFIVDFSPSMVREYMLQQLSNTEDVSVREGRSRLCSGGKGSNYITFVSLLQDSLLMNVIIEQMTIDSDPEMGGAVQLMGIIRTLLDPENMMASVNKSEKTDFLNYFYKHCMHVFIGEFCTLQNFRCLEITNSCPSLQRPSWPIRAEIILSAWTPARCSCSA